MTALRKKYNNKTLRITNRLLKSCQLTIKIGASFQDEINKEFFFSDFKVF